MIDQQTKTKNSPTMPAAGKWLHRLFKSPRLALVLILVLAGLSIAGIFIPQIPQAMAGNKDAARWWLDNIAFNEFGGWTGFVHALGLFNVFRSFWFYGAGLLLVINILVCVFSRIRSLKPSLDGPAIKHEKEFYNSSGHVIELTDIPMPVQKMFLSLSEFLNRHHYRIKQKEESGAYLLAGDKNRFSVFGTYAVHLSLLVLILGYFIGSSAGFRVESFIVPEGMTRNVGYDTGLSLQLLSFTDEYWTDGTPKDYRSDAVFYENGKEIKQATIRVNHPMTYKGVRFHQASYGPAANIKITDAANSPIFLGSVALPEIAASGNFQRPVGAISLPGTEYSIALLMSAVNAADDSLNDSEIGLELYSNSTSSPVGWAKLQQNVPYELEGMSFTYLGDTAFSAFLVSKFSKFAAKSMGKRIFSTFGMCQPPWVKSLAVKIIPGKTSINAPRLFLSR